MVKKRAHEHFTFAIGEYGPTVVRSSDFSSKV